MEQQNNAFLKNIKNNNMKNIYFMNHGKHLPDFNYIPPIPRLIRQVAVPYLR